MTTTATAAPREIDTELARLYGEMATARVALSSAWASVHRVAGDKGRYASRSVKVHDLSHEEARTAAELVSDGADWKATEARSALDRLDAALAHVRAIRWESAPFEAEFELRRWTRFFLVTGGHIHSSMSCSSCHATTAFGWLPDLSGKTEADAVAEHGALLCTFCFPSAPVEWTNGRELEAAAKAAARCPGTGKYVAGVRRYVACPACGASVARTPNGLVRAHKGA
jgi:hypothetical protein